MSLARAISRGAALKARLGVNGSQIGFEVVGDARCEAGCGRPAPWWSSSSSGLLRVEPSCAVRITPEMWTCARPNAWMTAEHLKVDIKRIHIGKAWMRRHVRRPRSRWRRGDATRDARLAGGVASCIDCALRSRCSHVAEADELPAARGRNRCSRAEGDRLKGYTIGRLAGARAQVDRARCPIVRSTASACAARCDVLQPRRWRADPACVDVADAAGIDSGA